MKKLLTTVSALVMTLVAIAQNPTIPNDPAVLTGKLDNGLTYYIRHNDLPKGRAEFYLATNAGAIQETPDQDGLAHFLEHMCFNGLKNLPGKDMLNYLQKIGAEFGRNINASTGVEHTQYMLNNIPVTREGILDTCLLVMHDYSHFVLNDPKEIDAERGVILEEKRTRNSAAWRMFEKSAIYMYGDCKYAHCNVIGSEDNLKNFKPESLKNFYESWYQPDNQAIIVVGDINVEQVYNKISKLFADVPAPAKPTVKDMPKVVVNDSTVVGILTDPENNATEVGFIWKLGVPTSKEMRGTMMGYVEDLLKDIVYLVMKERFTEITSKPDAPFTNAYLYVGDLCETCEAIEGNLTCENAKVLEATKAYLTEYEKVKRFGFTEDEVQRVKDNLIKELKDKVAGESTRKNPEFIRPLIGHFFNGTTYMAPQAELQLATMICSQLGADQINMALKEIFKGEHLTMIYQGIDKPENVHPDAAKLIEISEQVKVSEIAAPIAATISKDLLQGAKLKGAAVKSITPALYGAETWVLKNGLKVVVLPTEYKKNQVLFNLRKDGGLSLIPTEDLASFDNYVQNIFENNRGISDFSNTTVNKMLTGKTVNVSNYIKNSCSGVSGSCAPEDIETALQLTYLCYAKPRFDQSEWDAGINQLKAYVPNMVTTPDYVFMKHIYDNLFKSPRIKVITPEVLEQANLETYKKYYQTLYKDIAGAYMIIVGNVDKATLKPMVEKYLGSIAKGKKGTAINLENIPTPAKGVSSDIFKTKMNTPKASVFHVYSGNCKFSVKKLVDLKAAEFILDRIYTETLREEEGGTYGASANIEVSYEPLQDIILQVVFDTNTEQQVKLRELAIKGVKDLALNGPTDEQITSAVENAKKNLPEKRITNNYWMSALRYNAITGGNWDAEYEAAVNNITKEGIMLALAELLDQGNFGEIVMLPEE